MPSLLRTLFGCAWMLLASAACTNAAEPANWTGVPRAVRDYAEFLERVERSKSAAPVESLYSLGMSAGRSLLVSANGTDGPIDLLLDSVFATVQSAMRGFEVFRSDEGSGFLPDWSFFLSLARSRRDRADEDFFRAMSATQDGGGWPVYVEQQTDESGCTKYGSGRLVSTFAIWHSFATKHPGRYVEWAREEMKLLEGELLQNVCACDGRDEVLRELRVFLQQFPDEAIAPRVRARVRAIEDGTAGMRYQCIAG